MKFKTLALGLYQANCYILYDEKTKETAVIDPGEEFSKIKNNIDAEGLSVKYIILTHGHGDHIGALGELKNYTNAVVCIHKEDSPMLKIDTNYMNQTGPHVSADRFLEEGDILELGDMKLNIIHTPGHSRGGICIYCEGSLFSGDTLFACSIGRTDFYGGSFDAIIKSIKNKLLVLPDNTVVYPGHGPSSTILIEKNMNPFLR